MKNIIFIFLISLSFVGSAQTKDCVFSPSLKGLSEALPGSSFYIMQLTLEFSTEIWKDIPGYEGLYQVSNMGKIKQLKKGKCLSLFPNPKGYLKCFLYKDGIRETLSVHRLVAIVFVPNPENKPEVNHIKGIKTDNRWHELEWNTSKENTIHRVNVLGKKCSSGFNNPLSKAVEQLSLDGKIINTFGSTCEARRSKIIDAKSLNKCLKGEKYSARGFIWRFKKVA